jgi:nitrous oxidase accessory protein
VSRLPEGSAAVVAALVVVVGGVGALLGPTPASAAPDRALAYEPGTPEFDFERPSEPGTATVDGESFGDLEAALSAAEPGDTVVLSGRFDGRVTVETPNVTLTSADGERALLSGTEAGDTLTVAAADVTVDGLWVADSGYEAEGNDAGIFVDAANVTVRDSRVTDATFGIWVDGVPDARIVGNTIVGRDEIENRVDRGNGIQLWEATDAHVADNRITDARDGIYFSWASGVHATNNTMWDLRYGVHFMYSDDCVLVGNDAVGNDAGYALMVSENLTLRENVAFRNRGRSGHGILVKSVDDSTIADNDLVGNDNGLFVYNSLHNEIRGNLLLENGVGIHLSAGSVDERVYGNSFVRNDRPVIADVNSQVVWTVDGVGNYWSSASVPDTDGDGVAERRYRPGGVVQDIVDERPAARAFVGSPAFDLVRTAESRLPIVESPGVVDRRPLAEPPHDDWRRYYA